MVVGGGFGTSPLELLARDAMVQSLVYLDEFTYSAKWIKGTSSELAPGGDKTIRININSDSDFIAQAYNFTALGATADDILGLGPFRLTITRSGSGRNIMDDGILVANLCGNYVQADGVQYAANSPGSLPISSLYQGNSTVTYRLQNLSTTLAPSLCEFVMRGFKVFYQANRAGQVGNRQDIFHAL